MADQVDDLPLVPDDDLGSTPDEDLDAAAASALEAWPTPAEGRQPVPFGKTPLFDFEKGRFVKRGGLEGTDSPGAPVFVSGVDALKQWCLMAIYSARFAHPVFTGAFGMEIPESVIGEATGIPVAIADWGARMQEALLVHDRIVSVEDYEGVWDAEEGIITTSFTVITDQSDRLIFGPLDIQPLNLIGA